MLEGVERRVYQRSEGFHIEARVGRNKDQWRDAEVYDLSSEGLKFQVDEPFDVGDVLWFDMKVTKLFAEFEFIAQGEIRRKNNNVFGASFKDLNNDLKIRIDELVHNFKPENILY